MEDSDINSLVSKLNKLCIVNHVTNTPQCSPRKDWLAHQILKLEMNESLLLTRARDQRNIKQLSLSDLDAELSR